MRKTIHVEMEQPEWDALIAKARGEGHTVQGLVVASLRRYLSQPPPTTTFTLYSDNTWTSTGDTATVVSLPQQQTNTYGRSIFWCRHKDCDCPALARYAVDLTRCGRCKHHKDDHVD